MTSLLAEMALISASKELFHLHLSSFAHGVKNMMKTSQKTYSPKAHLDTTTPSQVSPCHNVDKICISRFFLKLEEYNLHLNTNLYVRKRNVITLISTFGL